jgi:hypothetical protein
VCSSDLAADFQSALTTAKAMVSAETQALIRQAAALKSGQAELPLIAAKLNMLQGPLGVYLPLEQRNLVLQAREQANSKLGEAQRKKIAALARRIAGGWEGRTVVEALAGSVDEKSFARRHAALAKPEDRQSWEQKFLTLWEERQSAGLPPFKNIVIDVRGSRGGRGDVAAGYLVAREIMARARRLGAVAGSQF